MPVNSSHYTPMIRKFPQAVILTFVFILSGISMSVNAEEVTAASVLKAAQSYFNNLNTIHLHATTEFAQGGISQVSIDLMKSPDGTMLQRCEVNSTMGTSKTTVLQITNGQGNFQLFPKQKVAGNMQFLTNMTQSIGKDMISSLGGGQTPQTDNLEMTEKVVNKRDCYEIVQTFSQDMQDTMRKVILDNPAMANLKKSGIDLDKIPVVGKIVYDIDKNESYIVAQSNYTASGDRMLSLNFDVVTANAPMDDSVFKIPKDYKIVKVSSTPDLVALMTKER